MALDTRRLPIPFVPGFEVDARNRVFAEGSHEMIPYDWPYVEITVGGKRLRVSVPEAVALAFLGEDGCEEAFRRLYPHDVGRKHPLSTAFANERGVSEWAVIEAGRRHHSQFRLREAPFQLVEGRDDPTAALHAIEDAVVTHYATYPVDGPGGLNDHVIAIGKMKFRTRQSGTWPMASRGDRVTFKYRLDRQGGAFIVRSTYSRSRPAP